MANILYYSNLNPVKFYLPEPDTTYNSRHIDDFEFFDTIPEWQEHVEYYQPWQTSDRIKLQLMADFGPHNIKVLDLDGNVIETVSFSAVLTNPDQPTLKVYELDLDLSVLSEGVYRLQLESGITDKLILISNKIDVCASHKHSLLLNYTHFKYHEGVLFQTGIAFNLRVEGANIFKTPASKDDSFEDQTEDETLQFSIPYRLFQLIIGDQNGVPPYLIDMINRVFTCSDVKIDNRKFTKPSGNKWEVNELDGYPLQGWKLEIRDRINRSSIIYSNNEPQNAKISIVINSDSKGFGSDTGGTVNEITDLQ